MIGDKHDFFRDYQINRGLFVCSNSEFWRQLLGAEEEEREGDYCHL